MISVPKLYALRINLKSARLELCLEQDIRIAAAVLDGWSGRQRTSFEGIEQAREIAKSSDFDGSLVAYIPYGTYE